MTSVLTTHAYESTSKHQMIYVLSFENPKFSFVFETQSLEILSLSWRSSKSGIASLISSSLSLDLFFQFWFPYP